nr:unnamed protein product [Callosobruchus analis]
MLDNSLRPYRTN